MTRNNLILFLLGLLCYAVCEVVPLTSAIFVWQIYGSAAPTAISSVPAGDFSWMVQFDKPALILFSLPSLFFFFWCFSYMKLGRFNQVLLYSFTTFAVILAIPDWLWYNGSPYYEILKYYSGLGSLFMAFVAITLYIQGWAFPEKMPR